MLGGVGCVSEIQWIQGNMEFRVGTAKDYLPKAFVSAAGLSSEQLSLGSVASWVMQRLAWREISCMCRAQGRLNGLENAVKDIGKGLLFALFIG